MSTGNPRNLFRAARACLDACEPEAKVTQTYFHARQWRDGLLPRTEDTPVEAIVVPGRPAHPQLVAPGQLARRSLGSAAGRAALLHALCHIEFNAINLAWDAVYRFREMPAEFYDDWIRVAEEEAYHFTLLRNRLREMGHDYGDFPAHNGLWEMACKTDHDVLVRMALVPRVLEARGLDVTPGMMDKLQRAGETRTVSILEIILRDEIGHVAIGSRWYRHLCVQRGLDPDRTFHELVKAHMPGQIKPPLHDAAREAAGFSADEMQTLKEQIRRKASACE